MIEKEEGTTSKWVHDLFSTQHPDEGWLFDAFGPFGLAAIGYFAMMLSIGINWAVRHVEVPLLIKDGEPVPDYVMEVFVDDYSAVMARRHAAMVRRALITAIEGVNFGWRGKHQAGIGESDPDQGIPDKIRVWIGTRFDLTTMRACVTDRLVSKCCTAIVAMLKLGEATPTEATCATLTGRTSFAAWTMAQLRPAQRVLWDMLTAIRRDAKAPWRPEWIIALNQWLTVLSAPAGVPGLAFGHFSDPGWADERVLPLFTDAQPGNADQSKRAGLGIFVGGFAIHASVPRTTHAWASSHMPTEQPDNNILESLAHTIGAMLCEALVPGISLDPGVPVIELTDSAVARCARENGSSKSNAINHMMQWFAETTAGRIDMQRLQPRQVASADCRFADPLSRWEQAGFQDEFGVTWSRSGALRAFRLTLTADGATTP